MTDTSGRMYKAVDNTGNIHPKSQTVSEINPKDSLSTAYKDLALPTASVRRIQHIDLYCCWARECILQCKPPSTFLLLLILGEAQLRCRTVLWQKGCHRRYESRQIIYRSKIESRKYDFTATTVTSYKFCAFLSSFLTYLYLKTLFYPFLNATF